MTPTGWLIRLIRTSGFRLILLYTGLFTVSVLILFVLMLWWGGAYVLQQIDQAVHDELGDVQAAAARPESAGLRAVVAEFAADAASGDRYLLENAAGKVLAGNMPSLPPRSGMITWYPDPGLLAFWPLQHGVRGVGVRLSDGSFLFVGRDTFALNEMREMVTRSFLWVLAATLTLAVAGGVVMSLGSLRRVEAIGRTSQEIIAGDLSRRIPVRGTGDEFDRLALSLNAMLDRIQVLMEGLNQVSSDIAHDLRTPLTRLRQRLELAGRRPEGVESLRLTLASATLDVDAILETFSALLRIAQIEAQSRVAEFTRVDLSDLLHDLVEFYEPTADEQGHVIAAEIAPDLLVTGDQELLSQMFANLIDNAIRHSEPGGAVTVAAYPGRQGIVAEVLDAGPGIPGEMREKVFQRFFRLERSRTTPGTGLGLSLVAAVAKIHHSSVQFVDRGPRFSVRLLIPSILGE
ncbi:MAG TPA: HAMP domain-containing sensor histidine kinase [Acetobacteraceae bacterium]|jgi:signal transduction histidine kinase|nr:HAMP domain-containing sensor histidine kinase [Acetobacteraceae bacterium]